MFSKLDALTRFLTPFLLAPRYRGAASAQEWAVRDELTAKATAFASDEVLNLWQRSALAYHAWEMYVDEEWPEATTAGSAERLGLEEEMEKDPEYRRFRHASDEAGKQLAEQIRVELDGRRQQAHLIVGRGR